MAHTNEENGDDATANTPEYRDRLRTWLTKMINSGTIPGLYWENDDKTIFRMPWKHAGRQDYSLEEDSKIFMAWAKHSGRYREGIDKPEPIVWKTRLRCALNKMPDIREIPERSRLDISEPYRVYQFLPPIHKDTQIRRRLQRRHSQAQSPPTAFSPKLGITSVSPTNYDDHRSSKSDSISFNNRHPSFTDTRTQEQTDRLHQQINHLDFGMRHRIDPRHASPWIGPGNLIPGVDRSLFPGRTLPQGFGSQLNNAGLLSPLDLFSNRRRDLHQRPPLDFPLFTYGMTNPHTPLLGPQTIPQLLSPSSAGHLPVTNGSTFSPIVPHGSSDLAAMTLSQLTRATQAAVEQRHQEQLTKSRLEEDNDRLRKSEKRLQREVKRLEEIKRFDIRFIQDDPHELKKRSQELTSEMKTVQTLLLKFAEETGNERYKENESYFENNAMLLCKIEKLERELSEYKDLNRKEKQARFILEKERENMKQTLERMGDDLMSLVVSNSGRSKKEMEKSVRSSASKLSEDNDSKIDETEIDSKYNVKNKRSEESRINKNTCQPPKQSSSFTPPSGFYDNEKITIDEQSYRKRSSDCSSPGSSFSSKRTSRKRTYDENSTSERFSLPSPLDLSVNESPDKRSKNDEHVLNDGKCKLSTSVHGKPSRRHSDEHFLVVDEQYENELNTYYRNGHREERKKSSSVPANHLRSEISHAINRDVQIRDSVERTPIPSFITSPNQSTVHSPSTSSSCSSNEESQTCSMSPTSNVPPSIPIFVPVNANKYPRYQGSVNSPIQVT